MNIDIKLEQGGITPKKATTGSAAYDLYIPEDVVVRPGRNVIPLNFRMQMEHGHQAQIEPRSGFSAKGMEGFMSVAYEMDGRGNISNATYTPESPKRYNADVLDGKIDCDYTGIVGVIIKSYEDRQFVVAKGTRIAQMTIQKVEDVTWNEVSSLKETERGDGGFGHTGTVGDAQ